MESFRLAIEAGSIGGLAFSLIGLFDYQPIILRRGKGPACLASHASLAGLKIQKVESQLN
jgi:hypothetical protein